MGTTKQGVQNNGNAQPSIKLNNHIKSLKLKYIFAFATCYEMLRIFESCDRSAWYMLLTGNLSVARRIDCLLPVIQSYYNLTTSLSSLGPHIP